MPDAVTSLAELGDIADLTKLTPKERRQLVKAVEGGSPFEFGDRLFGDWRSGDVFDYGDPNAREIRTMLDTDGTARQVEKVLTQPVRGADAAVVGGSARGRRLIERNLPGPQLDLVIAQCTSAVGYRKAFFELTWSIDGAGVRLDGCAFRPATSCQAAFDKHGRPNGYRQRLHMPGGLLDTAALRRMTDGEHPGYVRIPKQRAFIYTYGVHREPLTGLSDLSVAYWAAETRKRVMFLWLQYLESQSLPKVVAYGEDTPTATANAKAIAGLRGGGVAPVKKKGDPTSKVFEILEASGKGADQFENAMRLLDQWMVDSVLASFTKLAGSTQTGSYALSADQSEFFLAAEQAFADEIAAQITTGLFAPICIYNGLRPADVPRLSIGPISRKAADRALDLLKTLVVAQTVRAPDEYLDRLLLVTAPMLGLDADELRPIVERYRAQQAAAAEQERAAAAAQAAAETLPPDAPLDAPLDDVAVSNPEDPVTIALASDKDDSDGDGDGQEEHTGGMVCLVPDAASARRLLVAKPGAEPLDQLHLTLAYLGDDVTGWADEVRDEVPHAVRSALNELPGGPITARAFGHTTFNPDGGPDGDRDPCAVYMIGDSDRLLPLQAAVIDMLGDVDGLALPRQHEPYVPHVTAGYGLTAADLDYVGPVTFDRVAVVLGSRWQYIPLTPGGARA